MRARIAYMATGVRLRPGALIEVVVLCTAVLVGVAWIAPPWPLPLLALGSVVAVTVSYLVYLMPPVCACGHQVWDWSHDPNNCPEDEGDIE